MVPNHKNLVETYFNQTFGQFDFRTHEGCGKFTEGFVNYARQFDINIGHLRKYGSATQWNGHAIDAINYHDPIRGTYQSVDLLKDAETSNAQPQWLVQEVYYTANEWYLISEPIPEPEPEPCPVPDPNMIPWNAYWGDPASDKLMRTLMFDFSRKPEAYNPGMGRWISRCVHTAFIGPVSPSAGGQPLGVDGALARHRPEWCQALGGLDPNVPVPDSFFPEWR